MSRQQVVTAELANGAVTSAKILDATVATADLANAAVTNAKLASDTARANLLTNGGFEIWQRGNGPFTASGAYTADRWTTFRAGSDTLSVEKSANIPAGTGSNWCATCVFVLGSGAGTTALYQTLKLETGIQGRTFTFSIAVYATVANAVRAWATADGTGSPIVHSAFHPGNSTYQTLSVTITVPQNATNILVGCLFAASTGSLCFLDNAMLVVGSVAADYAPLHPADDLARCQRYYQRWGATGSSQLGAIGQAYSAGASVLAVQMQGKMPMSPTLTVSAASDFTLTNASAGALAVTSLVIGSSIPPVVFVTGNVASGLAAGNATLLQSATPNAWFALEGNP